MKAVTSSDPDGRPRREETPEVVTIGTQMARAHAAEKRHRARSHRPSPLAGIEYDGARGEHYLFRFRASPVDDLIHGFVENWARMGPDRRAEVQADLTLEDFYTLLSFGRRSALVSLRTHSAAPAVAGLDALAIIDLERVDWRDVVWAAGLLAYVLGRDHPDPSAALAGAASRSSPAVARIFERFIQKPADNLAEWGFREISTPDGIVLASNGIDPFTPTIDLFSIAMQIGDLVETDVWKVSDIETGTKLWAVWLQAGDAELTKRELGRVRACVGVRGYLDPAASPKASDQHLLAFLLECPDQKGARTLAESVGHGRPDDFAALGLDAGHLCLVLVARSFVIGTECYEHGDSLDRFRPGLVAILSAAWPGSDR